MPRLLVAVLACAAMGLSFVVVSLAMREGRGEPPPVALAPPAGASAAPPAAPARGAGALPPAAPTASPADPAATRRDLAHAAEQAEEALRAALLDLSGAEDATLERKLDVFRRGLEEGLEGEARLLLRHRGALTEIFLRLDPVQRDLAALDPGSRQSALDRIRREMGFSEAEVARMQEVDAHREARWENGLAYMAERARLAATFEGEALEEELQHLRERYFGFEAETLAREERQGFYRYERPRIYGRN